MVGYRAFYSWVYPLQKKKHQQITKSYIFNNYNIDLYVSKFVGRKIIVSGQVRLTFFFIN